MHEVRAGAAARDRAGSLPHASAGCNRPRRRPARFVPAAVGDAAETGQTAITVPSARLGRCRKSKGSETMIDKFTTVYPGHIDLGDYGQNATPANERRYTNEQLASVFEKTEAVAKKMDDLGYHMLWLAEHHFQHEGYEVIPNVLMAAAPSLPPDQTDQDRLRLQHRANVAPAAPRRGFRDGRHHDQRADRVRGRPWLSHAGTRDVRCADAGPGRQSRAVRGAGRDHLQGVQPGELLP